MALGIKSKFVPRTNDKRHRILSYPKVTYQAVKRRRGNVMIAHSGVEEPLWKGYTLRRHLCDQNRQSYDARRDWWLSGNGRKGWAESAQ